MGISPQQYRIRIGSFSVSSFGQRIISRFTANKSGAKTFQFNSKLRISLLLVLLICDSFIDNEVSETKLVSNSNIVKVGKENFEYLANSLEVVNPNFLARYKFGNRKKNGIKLAHINLGGGFLINKTNEIEAIISEYRPHDLGISETRFENGHSLEDLRFNQYRIYLSQTLENPSLTVSRVVVLVHEDVVVKERQDLMNNTFSSIWLELGLKRQKKILVSNVYRDWQYLHQDNDNSKSAGSQLTRWMSYLDQWEMAILENKEIICMGDMNIDFLKWSNASQPSNEPNDRQKHLTTQIMDRIIPHGFVQLISVPTHFWPGQKPSGLDHLYSNHPEKLSEVRAEFQGHSDHKIIFAIRNSKAPVSNPRIIRKRSYKNFDPTQFLQAVRNISWWEIYSCEDVDSAVQLFTNKLNNILNVMAPIKRIQVRTKYAPWISSNTKEKIQTRNQAQKAASETGQKEDWIKYKSIRNTVNNVLKKEIWQKEKINQYSNDSSSTWKHIKNWLGWSSGGPPSRLSVNGSIISKPSELAKTMNRFFIEKVRNLRQNLPGSSGNPLDPVRKLIKNRKCSFQLRCVHPDEVLKLIENVKSTKSCGTDNIDSYVIKLAKHELVPVITHIINLSIQLKKFPSLWKCAKVVPLHKKDEVTLPKNYRPVALLPITSKLLERAIFSQLAEYLEDNDILHPSHHGFRTKHNTSTVLLQMGDVWLEALENNEISAVIMLDMSAAFDVVDHDILLGKLDLYGLQESAVSWFEIYLGNRQQRVVIDGCLFDPLSLDAGVPQGSILGPLL